MAENMWPDFDVGQAPRSPKSVIEEYGEGLGERTKDKIQFYRSNLTIRDGKIVNVTYTLWTAPLRYHYPFMSVQFPVDTGYPVKLVADKVPDMEARDENELKTALARIFNAPSTVETIQRLLSLI